ncbi:hypothetical protein BQ8794_10139 [Mesorhizobium prunaredense]|uniref:Uncharacterized protein n=1 Tax=Mesorhizobium prunaredense TaxID=1631249 RepID=A0A1R3UYQ1_9HYPH|nr:hypothetical protein BQ8794_10139 [Mesorhizobium prunaredense]
MHPPYRDGEGRYQLKSAKIHPRRTTERRFGWTVNYFVKGARMNDSERAFLPDGSTSMNQNRGHAAVAIDM